MMPSLTNRPVSPLKITAWIYAVVLGLLLAAGPGYAYTLNLTGKLSGSQGMTYTPGGPYGSITITDNGNKVDFVVDLTTPGETASVISLNLAGNYGNTGWSASGGNIGSNVLTVSPDNAGWYSHFDIRLLDTGPYSDPLMFSLQKLGTDLDPYMFYATASEMHPLNVFATVRTNLSGETAYAATVPEPGTILLLGAGLAGLALISKRSRARS